MHTSILKEVDRAKHRRQQDDRCGLYKSQNKGQAAAQGEFPENLKHHISPVGT